jgi:hypothetical protein
MTAHSLNLSTLKIALEDPRFISPVSAWVEHIPFAFAAVEMLRPLTLVELGTHMGDSYCAFCQAVDILALPTQCTAVDTWCGDPQAGDYGDRILHDLRSYHDPRYGVFSRLLQMTFDHAALQFPDHSVDLLHIDGLHTYDAVHHDFNIWLPKMSPRGVVLLHDTRIQRDDFGVFQLWRELRQTYPSFEFVHGYGLGVLAVGPEYPEPFARFLHLARDDGLFLQNLFARLGSRIQLARGLGQVATQSANRLRAVSRALRESDSASVASRLPEPTNLLDPVHCDHKRWIDQVIRALKGPPSHDGLS